jgi:hypothetical protein
MTVLLDLGKCAWKLSFYLIVYLVKNLEVPKGFFRMIEAPPMRWKMDNICFCANSNIGIIITQEPNKSIMELVVF